MRVFSALRRIRTIHTLNTFPCGLGRREVIGPSVFLLEASGRWSDLVARARRGCRARTGQVGGFVPRPIRARAGPGPPGRDLGEGEPSFRTSTGGAAQRRVGGRDRPFGAAQVEVAPLPPCHAPNCPPMPVPPMPRGCHPPMPHAISSMHRTRRGLVNGQGSVRLLALLGGRGASATLCSPAVLSRGSVAAWVRGPSVGAGGFVARSAQGSFKGQAGCGTSRPLHVGATCRSNHWPPKGPPMHM